MLKIGPVLVLAFVLWAVRSEMRKPTMFAAAYGVSLLLFVSTSKQAFSNYYFLIAQALFLTVAALLENVIMRGSVEIAGAGK